MGMVEDALREYAKFEDRTTDPATPGAGEGLIFVKDGKLHTIDDAGTVVEYGAGGGGSSGQELIDSQILASAAATVTFSSIPQTYRELELWWTIRGTGGISSILNLVHITFNADTGAGNYEWAQLERRVDGNTTTGESGSDTKMVIGNASGGSSPAGHAGRGHVRIPGYRSAFNKSLVSQHTVQYSTGGSQRRAGWGGGMWKNTAAITSIEVSLSDGNVDTGSELRLYGIG